LTILEIEANHKNKGTLEHFKEIKLATAFSTINTDVFKSTIVIFLSEMLHHSIHEEEKTTIYLPFSKRLYFGSIRTMKRLIFI